jgi:arylsulfatase A-like enzyme
LIGFALSAPLRETLIYIGIFQNEPIMEWQNRVAMRPAVFWICVLIAQRVALASCPLLAAARPNVVVILSDDQGWGDLSLNGNTNLSTPNVDSLAREGAQFARFYVCPVCSPTRAEFLTGRYHPRSGVHNVSTGGERMNADEVTIAQTFKAAGYATAVFGKWHNGQQYPYHPNARGFDEFYGFCSGHWGDYFSPPLDHNGEIVEGHGYLEDDFTDRAMSFIEQHRTQPFFAYLAFNSPHSPMQVPDRWWNEFKNKKLKLRGTNAERENINHTRAALAMCENVDWNVGRVLTKLDELGIAANTIVVYFSDNGPNGNRWNGGLKGIKGTTDEGGVRSPLVIRWPGKIAAGTRVSQIAAAIDLLPTLAAVAKVPLVGTKPLDGKDLGPLLHLANNENGQHQATTEENRDRMIFSHWNGDVSVCTQQFRLDRNGKLFDLNADPGQLNDVSKEHPKIHARLAAAVAQWKKDLLAGLTDDKRPFTIGQPNSKSTQLAAADAVPQGGIRRSCKHPNSSFLTNWTSPADAITWNGEVLASGDYAAEFYYTCAANDVGSTIELTFNGNHVVGQVSEPNDQPLRGAEHDRVPREESYVKDFRPMKLGTIHLEEGRGKLILRATKIPGSQVMDFRLLVLRRTN